MPTTPKVIAGNSKNWRLFKLWVTLNPLPDSAESYPRRLTSYRSLGKLASKAFLKLAADPFIKLPNPSSSASTGNGSLISGITGSFSYTPRIGQQDPYIFITGHFYSDRDTKEPYSTRPVFSGGQLYHIPSSNSLLKPPSPNVLDDVKDLRVAIDTALDVVLPDEVQHKVSKIDYIGINFGIGGVHFPS